LPEIRAARFAVIAAFVFALTLGPKDVMSVKPSLMFP
jgi:hypothetical protein